MKRMFTAMLALILVLAFTGQAMAAKPKNGACERKEDGSKRHPYVLCTANDLQLLHAHPAAHFVLGQSIDLQGVSWTAVPSFSGSFDGNNRAIVNLSGYEGLFAQIAQGGVVKKLRLEQVDVSGGMIDAGSVASLNYGKIEFVHVSGEVEARFSAGGLVGINYGKIANSSMSGRVVSGYSTGGIASNNADSGVIERSQARIAVSSSYESGGIAGSNAGKIKHATVHGTVKASVTGVGGIVSSNLETGELANSVTYADVYYNASIPPEYAQYGVIYGSNAGKVTRCHGNGRLLPDAM